MPPKKLKKSNALVEALDSSCEVCKTATNDSSLYCDICCALFHPSCAGLNDVIYKKFMEVRDYVGWVCSDCRKDAAIKFDKLQGALSSLTEEVCCLKVEIESVKDKVGKSHVANLPTVSSYVEALKTPSVKSELHNDVRNIIKDADRRSRNVVITGLQPASGHEDASLVKSIFEDHFTFKPFIDPSSCKRIGKEIPGKPRRLLVSLRSSDEVDATLRCAKSLRNSTNHYTAANIFINRDLSPEEAKVAYEKRIARRAQTLASSTSASTSVSAVPPSIIQPTASLPAPVASFSTTIQPAVSFPAPAAPSSTGSSTSH